MCQEETSVKFLVYMQIRTLMKKVKGNVMLGVIGGLKLYVETQKRPSGNSGGEKRLDQ